MEKELATHSSVLAWRIPGTGEPGGLPSMGSHRVGHDWSNLAAAAANKICRSSSPLELPYKKCWRNFFKLKWKICCHIKTFESINFTINCKKNYNHRNLLLKINIEKSNICHQLHKVEGKVKYSILQAIEFILVLA